jgi:hypothetical protein
LREIATQVSEGFPHRFNTWKDALPHVGKLSDRYSQ